MKPAEPRKLSNAKGGSPKRAAIPKLTKAEMIDEYDLYFEKLSITEDFELTEQYDNYFTKLSNRKAA